MQWRVDVMKPSTITREKPRVEAMARRCDEVEYYNEGKSRASMQWRVDVTKPRTLTKPRVEAMVRQCDDAEYHNEGKAARRGDGALMQWNWLL